MPQAGVGGEFGPRIPAGKDDIHDDRTPRPPVGSQVRVNDQPSDVLTDQGDVLQAERADQLLDLLGQFTATWLCRNRGSATSVEGSTRLPSAPELKQTRCRQESVGQEPGGLCRDFPGRGRPSPPL